ncbi:DMT family transporter [Leptospira langatensis]|uniref:DMT family transporter n=1 Tax=Leptospira langatensis TaxID=2484983 RepID=A0A5F1ZRV9_9LEPT|nr:DMT family transporter [Leptospira langatensis]TGK02556.1 DMT family transporter [Leptospira langatensis]TGL40243.1 DMT family transporter [Leptospira langatensis]
MNRYRNEFALIFCTMIWGGTFSATKMSLISVSSCLFIGIRFAIASLIFLIYIFIKQRSEESKFPNLRENKGMYFLAFLLGFWMFLGFAFETVGLRFTSATKSGFLTGTLVVITPILQTIFWKKTPNSGNLLGVIVVMLGLFFLSSEWTEDHKFIISFRLGDVLTLCGAFFFSLYIIYVDKASRSCPLDVLLLSQTLVTSIFSFGLAFLLDSSGFEPLFVQLNEKVMPALLYNGIISSVGTTFLQTKYQQGISPTRAGLIFSLEPVFSAILAYFTLGETLEGTSLLGCGLILTGVILAELLGRERGIA